MRNLEFRALEIFKSHHFTVEDAEALIEYIREAKSDVLSTKKDLADSNLNIIKEVRLLDKEIKQIELKIKDLEVKIESTSNTNIKWFVATILAQTGLIFTLLKLFDKI